MDTKKAKKPIQCVFADVRYQRGQTIDEHFTNVEVSLEKKDVFIGLDGKYSIKLNTVQSLEHNDDGLRMLAQSKHITVKLTASHPTNADKYARLCGKLDSKTDLENAPPSRNSTVISSLVPPKPQATRKAFGARGGPAVPLVRHEVWADADADFPVAPRKLPPSPDNYAPAKAEQQIGSADEHMSYSDYGDEEPDDELDSALDYAAAPPKARTKRTAKSRLTRYRGNGSNRSAVVQHESDSDDDDVFDDKTSKMTTPSSGSHLVSASKTDTTIVDKDDASHDDMTPAPPRQDGQKTIRSFFERASAVQIATSASSVSSTHTLPAPQKLPAPPPAPSTPSPPPTSLALPTRTPRRIQTDSMRKKARMGNGSLSSSSSSGQDATKTWLEHVGSPATRDADPHFDMIPFSSPGRGGGGHDDDEMTFSLAQNAWKQQLPKSLSSIAARQPQVTDDIEEFADNGENHGALSTTMGLVGAHKPRGRKVMRTPYLLARQRQHQIIGQFQQQSPRWGLEPLMITSPQRLNFKTTATTPNPYASIDISAPPPAPPARPCRGLRNMGNTCYLNASIQMLLSHAKYAAHLWQQQQQPHVSTTVDLTSDNPDDPLPLMHALAHVARQLKLSPRHGAFTPDALKQAVDRLSDKFVGYEQRDAHEFLGDLVDHLHEERQRVLEGQQQQQQQGSDAAAQDDTSPDVVEADRAAESQGAAAPSDKRPVGSTAVDVQDDFKLVLQVHLHCMACGYARNKDEIYRHLSIDVVDADGNENINGDGRPASVQAGLDKFFSPEIRELRCEKCHDGTHAQQTLRIVHRPQALLLHLKRFLVREKPVVTTADENNENVAPNTPPRFVPPEYVFLKNKAPVEVPQSLSLDKYCEDDHSAVLHYEVQSIVHHLGKRASSGHYTADAVRMCKPEPEEGKNKDEATMSSKRTWVTFDDGNSTRTTWEAIAESDKKQRSAYMLLYTVAPSDQV